MPTTVQPNQYRISLPQKLEHVTHTTRALSVPSELTERFVLQRSHYVASSLGNTYESGKNFDDLITAHASRVLDGLASQLLFDAQTGEVIGIAAGVSDALGHTDEAGLAQAKASLAHGLAAHFNRAVEKYESTSWNAKDVVTKAHQAALDENTVKKDNEATIAGIHILQTADKSYTAHAVNIGDCMIAVYQHATQTMLFLPPTVIADVVVKHKDPRKLFMPPSTARLNDQTLLQSELKLTANDIVFLMTDGYWDNMPIEKTIETVIEKTTNKYNDPVEVIKKNEHIDPEFFLQIIAKVKKDHPYPRAQHFHAALHEAVLSQQTELRERYLRLLPIVTAIKDEALKNQPVSAWLQTLSAKDAADMRAILASTQHGDGAAIEESHIVRDFVPQFLQLSFGDDCALTVVCVPDPNVEYVRRAIEMKKHDGRKLESKEINNAILFLAQETNVSGPIYTLSELKTFYKLLGGNELKTIRFLEEAHFAAWASVTIDKNNLETLEKSLEQIETTSTLLRVTLDKILGAIAALPKDNTNASRYFGKDKMIEHTLLKLDALIAQSIIDDTEYQLNGYGEGYTTVHHAANLGLCHTTKRLFEITPAHIHAKGEFDRTLLHMAIFRLDSAMVILLLAAGVPINAQTNAEDHLRSAAHILFDRLSNQLSAGHFSDAMKIQASLIINALFNQSEFDGRVTNAQGESVNDCFAKFKQKILDKLPEQEANAFIAGLQVRNNSHNLLKKTK